VACPSVQIHPELAINILCDIVVRVRDHDRLSGGSLGRSCFQLSRESPTQPRAWEAARWI
jgi:hypothetical protein